MDPEEDVKNISKDYMKRFRDLEHILNMNRT